LTACARVLLSARWPGAPFQNNRHTFLLTARLSCFQPVSWRALHLNGFGHRFWRALHLNRLMGGISPNPDNVACSIHHRGLQCSLWFKWMVLFSIHWTSKSFKSFNLGHSFGSFNPGICLSPGCLASLFCTGCSFKGVSKGKSEKAGRPCIVVGFNLCKTKSWPPS
jgi:hypothetical protein